jgi:hypothetical protein
LGEGLPFAQRFLAAYRNSGLVASPTVVQELVAIAGSALKAQPHAMTALSNMRRWNIQPIDLISVGHGITGINAEKLIGSGILAEGEVNDGLILIETALIGVPSLISSDKHLLTINPVLLVKKLEEFDLPPVTIYSPKDFLR